MSLLFFCIRRCRHRCIYYPISEKNASLLSTTRPKLLDPSELRTDVTGKVVRYLQENGAMVEAGQPYVEVEAMKMIVPIKTTESGRITNNLSPGSVISAGDLLATLELKDPSKTHKIANFEGSLGYKTSLETDAKELATYLLAGYKVSI